MNHDLETESNNKSSEKCILYFASLVDLQVDIFVFHQSQDFGVQKHVLYCSLSDSQKHVLYCSLSDSL
jgi:hypothetical protein